jgi:predicted nucleic acid-binding protein
LQLVIADTGPVNYLILIGHIDVLPALLEKVILPDVVRDELKHSAAQHRVHEILSAFICVHLRPTGLAGIAQPLELKQEKH